MQKSGFIINVFIMSGSMLIIRIAGIVSNIYISTKAGAEAMGLYHVIFSVYSFAITISVSGTGLAATRLISENVHKSSHFSDLKTIKRCITISLFASVTAASVLFFGSNLITKIFIDDVRCIPALKILALSLPFIGVSAVLRGGFIALRKASVITGSQLIEEFSSIFITIFILKNTYGTSYAYMSMIIGNCISEIIAFLYDFVFAKRIFKNVITKNQTKYKDIFSICVPVAIGSYLRSALVAAENILIPKELHKFGISNPLSEYGIIKGMAMQMILFPTVFIQSFASMLVPEMSEMNASMRKNGIKHVAYMAIQYTLIFSFATAFIFWKYHEQIAHMLYKSEKVSVYLGILSFLVIPMYLDSVVDGMLKGLNQQMSNLRYNIADSVFRIIVIWIFLPKHGITAYLILLYASEIFNLTLSIKRLIKISDVRIKPFECIVVPVSCALIAHTAMGFFRFSHVISKISVFIVIYTLLCTVYMNYQKQ